MKKILFILMFGGNTFIASAQCVLRMDYITEEERSADNFNDAKEEGNFHLPPSLITNLSYLNSFFGVKASGKLYDSKTSYSSKVACDCQNKGCAGTVYLGKNLVNAYSNNWTKSGDGLLGIMAHEVAHLYQCNKGSSLTGKQRELHADFLAGYYLSQKAFFSLTNFQEFANELFTRGDFNFTDPNHHGTPAERVLAMQHGQYINALTLEEAYKVGERYVKGKLGDYNLTGFWNSTTGSFIEIYDQGGNIFYKATYNGITNGPFLAIKTGFNLYNVSFFNDNILIYVVDDFKAVFIHANGYSGRWTR